MRFYLVVVICCAYFDIAFCQTILAYGLSENEQKTVLDIHNDYRKTIANGSVSSLPRGTNLKRLKYDETLANEAQKIANTTNFAHVTVSNARWSAVGQNLYLSASTGSAAASNWRAAIKSWYNEYTAYTYSKCCTSSTGHFTQVIWATTEYVGCGWVFYYESGSFPYKKLHVCNYGPAGNYVGSYPYQNGTSGCENLCD